MMITKMLIRLTYGENKEPVLYNTNSISEVHNRIKGGSEIYMNYLDENGGVVSASVNESIDEIEKLISS